jgi:hypothetical protein
MSKHTMNEPRYGPTLGLIGPAPMQAHACPDAVARGCFGTTLDV